MGGGIRYESACGYRGASHAKRNTVSLIRDLVGLLSANDAIQMLIGSNPTHSTQLELYLQGRGPTLVPN